MTTPTICCYQTGQDLPGERFTQLITADGSQFAWAARPDDRRGASLIFDGLVATGMNWRVNPAIRVDIKADGDHLVARLRVRGTKQIIITNAHYLAPRVRHIAIELAARVGADLVFSYEDGHGTTLHSSGLLDDAERYGWPCHPEMEPPFAIQIESASDDGSSLDGTETQFPAVISCVGFGLFRAWNRHLLTAEQFTYLDVLYCDTYRRVRALTSQDAESIAELAHDLLNQSTRSQAVTVLRAMQAALFRNGVLWRIPLSTLDAWRESPDSVTPTEDDFRRLTQLIDAETAAIAVLAALNIPIDKMRPTRLIGTTVTGPNITPTPIPDAALFPLQVVSELNNGVLVTRSQRHISLAIRYLTQQFGFPLPSPRGQVDARRPLMHPDTLQLVHYRTEDE